MQLPIDPLQNPHAISDDELAATWHELNQLAILWSDTTEGIIFRDAADQALKIAGQRLINRCLNQMTLDL